MLTPEQTAQIVGVSARAIYASAESRKVHFSEMPNGSLLICWDSLACLRTALNR